MFWVVRRGMRVNTSKVLFAIFATLHVCLLWSACSCSVHRFGLEPERVPAFGILSELQFHGAFRVLLLLLNCTLCCFYLCYELFLSLSLSLLLLVVLVAGVLILSFVCVMFSLFLFAAVHNTPSFCMSEVLKGAILNRHAYHFPSKFCSRIQQW